MEGKDKGRRGRAENSTRTTVAGFHERGRRRKRGAPRPDPFFTLGASIESTASTRRRRRLGRRAILVRAGWWGRCVSGRLSRIQVADRRARSPPARKRQRVGDKRSRRSPCPAAGPWIWTRPVYHGALIRRAGLTWRARLSLTHAHPHAQQRRLGKGLARTSASRVCLSVLSHRVWPAGLG